MSDAKRPAIEGTLSVVWLAVPTMAQTDRHQVDGAAANRFLEQWTEEACCMIRGGPEGKHATAYRSDKVVKAWWEPLPKVPVESFEGLHTGPATGPTS